MNPIIMMDYNHQPYPTAMSSSTSVSSGPEFRFRVLKEGEVSPYKLTVVIFVREFYSHIELRRGSPQERFGNLLLMNHLINSCDKKFGEMISMIESPNNRVRPEILKRFYKVLVNIEDYSASFLNELVHSLVDVDGTQTVVLRKRIGRNSPFGKFLREVMINLKRLSYAQIVFLFHELQVFIDFQVAKANWESVCRQVILAESQIPHQPLQTKRIGKRSGEKGSVTRASRKADSHKSEPIPAVIMTSHGPVAVKIEPVTDPLGSERRLPELSSPPTIIIKQEPGTIPPPGTSAGDVLVIPVPGSDSHGKLNKFCAKRRRSLDIFQNMMNRRKLSGKDGLSMSVFGDYAHEYRIASDSLNPDIKKMYEQRPIDRTRKVQLAIENQDCLRRLWMSAQGLENKSKVLQMPSSPRPHSSLMKEAIDRCTRRSPRKIQLPNKSPTIPKKSPPHLRNGAIESFNLTDDGFNFSEDESEKTHSFMKGPRRGMSPKGRRGRHPGSGLIRSTTDEPVPSRWTDAKWWSRRQIDSTIQKLVQAMNSSDSYLYSPFEVSSFVETVQRNPSSQTLLPQIHFLEYLNSKRIKDISRATDALRTSFDLRTKPCANSEVAKGTPYAAYNFAVFYMEMGFRKDAFTFLEEAFQSGHSAGDSCCLQFCHNLWCILHGNPYKEAILPVTREADKTLTYMHSLNVLANAMSMYGDFRMYPEEILRSVWAYNPDYDLKQIEALLLSSLSSFFGGFGWHKLIILPCLVVLYSNMKWPTTTWTASLCLAAQCCLSAGNGSVAEKLMNYGKQILELDASPAGELFGLQNGVFKAMSCFYAYEPVDQDVEACIAAYNRKESLYWRAFSAMITSRWEEAGQLVQTLFQTISKLSSPINMDLRLRCLLLQAELCCLNDRLASSLEFLYAALKLARIIASDFYVTLCVAHIASVQNALGMESTASQTIHLHLRSLIRSSCPILDARLDIVNTRLRLTSPLPMEPQGIAYMFHTLVRVKQVYSRWNNNYRIKDTLNYIRVLLERREVLQLGEIPMDTEFTDEAFSCGNASGSSKFPASTTKLGSSVSTDNSSSHNTSINVKLELAKVRKEMDAVIPILPWSPETCLL